MDAAAESGRNPVSKHQIRLEWGWRGTGRPNSSSEIKFSFPNESREKCFYSPCSADHGEVCFDNHTG